MFKHQHETEQDQQIRLQTIKELISSDIPTEEKHRYQKMKQAIEHPHFLFRRTKANIVISLVCIALICAVGGWALTPVNQVTSSNLVTLNGNGQLQSYDGSVPVTLSALTNALIVTPSNGQIFTYNSTSGLWQNENAPGSNSYSMENLTDSDIVSPLNGNIAIYNGSAWVNQQPFTSGWNATVNQLIGLASISTSQISGLSSYVATYLSTNAPYLPNSGVGAYSYLISTFTNATNTYYHALNGTTNQIVTGWTSTNASAVFDQTTSIGNQNIFVSSGTYNLPNGWYISSRYNFISGAGNSTILYSSANNAIVHLYYAWGTIIQNLEVQGNNQGSSQVGVYIDNALYSTIQHVNVMNTGADGVYGATANYATVTYCDVENVGVGTQASPISTEDTGCGIEFYNSWSNTVSFCHTNMTLTSGIKFTGYGASTSDSDIVSNNHVEQYGSSNGGNGIEIYDTSHSSFSLNNIKNGFGSVSEGHGMSVENGSDYNTLTSNTIINVPYNGIDISTSIGNIMTQNSVDTAAASGYEIYMSNNTVIGSATLNNTAHDGVKINVGSYYNTIQAITVFKAGQNGIDIIGSNNNLIQSCTIQGYDIGNTGTFDGICINASSSNDWIQNNIISSSYTHNKDIQVFDSPSTNNTIFGNFNATISDSGTGTMFMPPLTGNWNAGAQYGITGLTSIGVSGTGTFGNVTTNTLYVNGYSVTTATAIIPITADSGAVSSSSYVTNYAKSIFNSTQFPNIISIKFQAIITGSASGTDSGSVELYDLTAGSAVTGSVISATGLVQYQDSINCTGNILPNITAGSRIYQEYCKATAGTIDVTSSELVITYVP